MTICANGPQKFSPQLLGDYCDAATDTPNKIPWNKGKIVGQKAPLKLRDIWAIRIRLQLGRRTRELALVDLGLDSKLSFDEQAALASIQELNRLTIQHETDTNSRPIGADVKLLKGQTLIAD